MLYTIQEIVLWRVWVSGNFIRIRWRKGDNCDNPKSQNSSKWWSPLDTAVNARIPQKVENSWRIQQLFYTAQFTMSSVYLSILCSSGKMFG